jgi:GntR family transcriptional regulator / MocR family aminotransferase
MTQDALADAPPPLAVGFVTLDRGSREPLGSQLRSALRDAVRTGRLRTGDRVPASRSLADALGVSRGVVVSAYEQLTAEGYLESAVGAGTLVSGRAWLPPRLSAQSEEPAPAMRFDLRSGIPDLRSFPAVEWSRTAMTVVRTMPTREWGYGEVRGSGGLRRALASYLRRVRGAAVDEEDLLVTHGFAEGIALAIDACIARGIRLIAVEDPGDRSVDAAVRAAGGIAVPVPVDEEGLDVAVLAATDARAVVVTPAHQSPTGAILSAARRRALVEWADAVDGLIVEDDYDSEFRYDRDPVGTLHGLRPERTVLLGTTSKTLAPGLRLGWLAATPTTTAAIAERRSERERGHAVIDQETLARFIESGSYERHIRRMRSVYSARRRVLVESVRTHLPGMRLSGLAAGFHAILPLPSGTDENAVVEAARLQGIAVSGVSAHRIDPRGTQPALVIGFGNVDDEGLRAAVAIIARLVDAGA